MDLEGKPSRVYGIGFIDDDDAVKVRQQSLGLLLLNVLFVPMSK